MRFRLFVVLLVCCAVLSTAAGAAAIPLPHGGEWEGPINGHLNFQTGQHHPIGSVRFCVSGDRVERIAMTIEIGSERVHANLGHAQLFQTVIRPPHPDPDPRDFQRATAFHVPAHHLDPRLSIRMSVRWLQYGWHGQPQQIIDHLGAQGDLWETEAGRHGETSVKRTLGPIHRTGDC